MGQHAVGMRKRIASSGSLCGLALVLALFMAGCAWTSPAEDPGHEPAREAVVGITERMRAIISAGQPSDEAGRQIGALRDELKMLPRISTIPGLLGALRDGQDECNSVLIGVLDEFNATDWVPIRFRARTMTIGLAIELVGRGAQRAQQADAYIGRVREVCSDDPTALVTAWIGLLESPPIYAWQSGRKVDVTCPVQGLAVLGLIRSTESIDLGAILERTRQNRVTAPAPHLSQLLIHLSGKKLKQNLAQWLQEPGPARIAALMAIDLLRLRAAQFPPSLTLESVEAAVSWVERIPTGSTWQGLAYSELMALAPKAGEREPKLDPQEAARLLRARRLLDVPAERDSIRWLSGQPVTDRLRALESLIGIDILMSL